MFFEGQNSRLFQLASHVSLTLRLSLLFNEVRNKIGSAVAVRIGAPVPFRALSHLADHKALAEHLRRATYELGGRRDCTASSVPLALRDRRDLLCATRQRLAQRRRKRSCAGRA
jgi:putative hemolysin